MSRMAYRGGGVVYVNCLIIGLLLLTVQSGTAAANSETMRSSDFTIASAIGAVDAIQVSLRTCGDLVDIVLPGGVNEATAPSDDEVVLQVPSERLKDLAARELDWRQLNMVAPNNVLRIKGMLLKAQMEINLQQYKIAETGAMEKQDNSLEEIRARYLEAKEDFEEYMTEHHWFE